MQPRSISLTQAAAREASCSWHWPASWLPALPFWELSAAVWLLVFFSWTSVFAMVIAAATGQRGLAFRGSAANKLVFALYLVGGVAVFPAAIILVLGLLRAL